MNFAPPLHQIRDGGVTNPVGSDATVRRKRAKARFQVTFNPASFVLALDEVVFRIAGITLYLKLLLLSLCGEGRRLQGVRLCLPGRIQGSVG